METKDKDFYEYAGRIFKERMKQLGLTKYRFHKDNKDITSMPTLMNILSGKESKTKTLVEYCERLGLKMQIVQKERPKEDCLKIEQTAYLYELGFDTEGILHPTIGDLMKWIPKYYETADGIKHSLFTTYDVEDGEWIVGYENITYKQELELINALYELLVGYLKTHKK